ncbi:MAG: Lacal_2735 family protein [Flavobacteriales bacterium]|nr:Lacal_2735 family protein [Flavobacteriales bacterium]MBP7156164.1 Lacal_2735 family protein [Flavobacteriales bacterium]
MFNLFKKKDPREAVMKRYRELLAESHRLSTIDRKASDLKRAEAENLLDEFDQKSKKGTL